MSKACTQWEMERVWLLVNENEGKVPEKGSSGPRSGHRFELAWPKQVREPGRGRDTSISAQI